MLWIQTTRRKNLNRCYTAVKGILQLYHCNRHKLAESKASALKTYMVSTISSLAIMRTNRYFNALREEAIALNTYNNTDRKESLRYLPNHRLENHNDRD